MAKEGSHAGHVLHVPDSDTWQLSTFSSYQVPPIIRPSNTCDGLLPRVDDVPLLVAPTVDEDHRAPSSIGYSAYKLHKQGDIVYQNPKANT